MATLYSVEPSFLLHVLRYTVFIAPFAVALFLSWRNRRRFFWYFAVACVVSGSFWVMDPLRLTEERLFCKEYKASAETILGGAIRVPPGHSGGVSVFEGADPLVENTQARDAEELLRSGQAGTFCIKEGSNFYAIAIYPSDSAVEKSYTVRYQQGLRMDFVALALLAFLCAATFLYQQSKTCVANGFTAANIGRLLFYPLFAAACFLLVLNILSDKFFITTHLYGQNNFVSVEERKEALRDPNAFFSRRQAEPDEAYFLRVSETLHKLTTHYNAQELPRVAFTTNWYYWLLEKSGIRETYTVYHDYTRFLRRGFGLCGDHAVAACDILRKNGFACNPIGIDGHIVSQAFTLDGREILLDADYGVILPCSRRELGQNPDLVLPYYTRVASTFDSNYLRSIYAKDNVGPYLPEDIERLSSPMRWALPGAVFLFGLGLIVRGIRRPKIPDQLLRLCEAAATPWIALLYGGVALFLGTLVFLSPEQVFPVSNLRHDSGHCWIASVPPPSRPLRIFYVAVGDSESNTMASPLVLLEDGAPLASPHSSHEYIRLFGQGRYSHWERNLFFSSSDNSAPTDNGRRYTARTTLSARLWVRIAAVFSPVLFCGALVYTHMSRRRNSQNLMR